MSVRSLTAHCCTSHCIHHILPPLTLPCVPLVHSALHRAACCSSPPLLAMAGDTVGVAGVDSLVVATLHSIESCSPPATASPASLLVSPPSSASRPSSSSRSAAVESLSGRQWRAECLHRLLPALASSGLLTAYQRSIVSAALSSYSPRYLSVVDAWLQCERTHQLSVRAAVRSTPASGALVDAAANPHSALPIRPTSLCAPRAAVAPAAAVSDSAGSSPPSELPLSSLLSSGSASFGFSPSRVLAHLLTSALVGSLEEAWLACFMSIPTVQAKRVSRAERVRLELGGSSELVYGEIVFASLARILWSLHSLPRSGGRFVDLGSGAGRGVIGALLLHDWEEVRGIEVLDGLYRASELVREKVERDRKAGGLGGVAVLQHHHQQQYVHQQQSGEEGSGDTTQQRARPTRIVFTRSNFFDADWSDADVVLANSVCFSALTMQRLAEQASTLKQGAYCQSTTHTHAHSTRSPLMVR